MNRDEAILKLSEKLSEIKGHQLIEDIAKELGLEIPSGDWWWIELEEAIIDKILEYEQS